MQHHLSSRNQIRIAVCEYKTIVILFRQKLLSNENCFDSKTRCENEIWFILYKINVQNNGKCPNNCTNCSIKTIVGKNNFNCPA